MKTQLSAGAALAVVILAVFTVWIDRRAKTLEESMLSGSRTPALSGKTAPDFSLPALDGHTVSMADYRGKKKLVVAFWASWCGPCRAEMPALGRLYAAAHKEDSDFEVLAISVDDERPAAAAFAEQLKMPYPVLLDPDMKAANAFQVESIPTSFVIEPDGKITYAKVGYGPGEEMIVAQQLGIRDYMPFRGGMNVRRGN
jgi:peroxiredoxin